MNLTFLVKTLKPGQVKASVLELPAYQVESSSKASAIADLKALLLDQIQGAEILSWQFPMDSSLLPDTPWKRLFGLFRDDPYYDQVLDIIQAERDALGDEDLDPAYYMTNE
jgi:hypothetical protein